MEAEVQRLLGEAEATDEAKDQRCGKGRRGDELPKEALERDARERAEEQRREQEENKGGRGPRGRLPKPPGEESNAKAQRNFNDPDWRIMKDSATKSFAQAYNCQAVVGGQSQVIVACQVTQQANDKGQSQPLVEQVKANLHENSRQRSADNRYYSEENVGFLAKEGIDGYIAAGRQKHTDREFSAPRGRIPQAATAKERMARKLQTIRGRGTYAKRKQIVEPVFGQIKQVRGFREFLLRGFENVSAEWDRICLGHNLLKLFRGGWASAMA